MADNRQQGPGFYRGLKSAVARQLAVLGGSTTAESFTRLSRQQIEACASLGEDHAMRFLPLDVVADIDVFLAEHDARPVIAEHLAMVCGYMLVRLPGRIAPLAAATTTLREVGEMISALGTALSDGEISKSENRILRAEAAGAIDALQALIGALDNEKNKEE